MNIVDAERLFVKKCEDAGLLLGFGWDGWHLKWTNNAHNLGKCLYGFRMLRFSRLYVEKASVDDVEKLFVHEIAHALVGSGHGHDVVWRAKCLELGGDGKRLTRVNYSLLDKGWQASCSNDCFKPIVRKKCPRVKYRCKHCKNSIDWREIR